MDMKPQANDLGTLCNPTRRVDLQELVGLASRRHLVELDGVASIGSTNPATVFEIYFHQRDQDRDPF